MKLWTGLWAWLHSQLLHGLLPRRQNGRPLHEPVQDRQDPGLLPAQCPAHAQGISGRLRHSATREHGARLIEEELGRVPSDRVRDIARKRLAMIGEGEKGDFRF